MHFTCISVPTYALTTMLFFTVSRKPKTRSGKATPPPNIPQRSQTSECAHEPRHSKRKHAMATPRASVGPEEIAEPEEEPKPEPTFCLGAFVVSLGPGRRKGQRGELTGRHSPKKWKVRWSDGKITAYSQSKLKLADPEESAPPGSFKRRSRQISQTILQLALNQTKQGANPEEIELEPKPATAPKPTTASKPKLKFKSKKLKKSKVTKKSAQQKNKSSPPNKSPGAFNMPVAVITDSSDDESGTKDKAKAAAPAKPHSSVPDEPTIAPKQDMWSDHNPPTVFGRCNWHTLANHLFNFGQLGNATREKSDVLDIFHLISRLAITLSRAQQWYCNSVAAVGHAARQVCEIVVLCLDEEGRGGVDEPSATDLVMKGDIPAAVARLRNRGANVDICTLLVEPAEIEKVDKFDETVECLWALGKRADHVFLPDFRVADKAHAIGSIFRCACAVSQRIRARYPQEWANTAPRVKAEVVMVKAQFFCAKLEEEPTALVTVVHKEWSGDFPPLGTRVDMRIGRRMEKNPRNGRWKFSIGLDVKRI